MSGSNAINISLLMWGCILSLILALSMFISKNYDREKRICVIMNELIASLLMFADAMSCIFRGHAGVVEHYILRVSGFLCFALSDAIFIPFTMYVTTQIFGTYRMPKEGYCRRVRASYILSLVGIGLVFFSQFSRMYYFYDENNLYHRATLFPLSTIIPAIIVVLLTSLIVEKRKKLRLYILHSMLCFTVFPTLGVLVSMFVRGFSFGNISIGITITLLYFSVVMEQNIQLGIMASTDAKSGLLNTQGYGEELGKLVHKEEVLNYNAYVFNLRNFSLVNRKYGTEEADKIILKYCKVLKSYFEEGELLARMGSDNFMALVRRDRTEQFLEMLQGMYIVLDEDSYVHAEISAIVGGYEIEDLDIDQGEIMTNAAMALAVAKSEQKQVAFLSKELREHMLKNRQLEEQLPRALKKKEFQAFYQPKVDINTGKLCGAEALVRWFREGTMVSPGEFIPVFEKNNSICDIDFYMLRCVCEDLAGWIKEGIEPPRVSVNFSRRHLSNSKLAEEIANLLDEFKLPKGQVEVEVTETMDEFTMNALKRVVDGLRDRGIPVAIDDFGTGSSSLNLLRDMDFDVLKIDKSFVDHSFDKDLKILGHIISIAKDLNVSVIAEGVEHLEQIETLRKLGCDRVQGFLYDRPLSKVKFEERLRNPVYQMESVEK